MNVRWTKHLKSQKDKDEFKQVVVASHQVLERLEQILKEKEEESIKEIVSRDSYKYHAWSEYQADKLGYLRALRDLGEIVKIEVE